MTVLSSTAVYFKMPHIFVNHSIKETLTLVLKEKSRKCLFCLFKLIFRIFFMNYYKNITLKTNGL